MENRRLGLNTNGSDPRVWGLALMIYPQMARSLRCEAGARGEYLAVVSELRQ
jgi:hypothetical protein